MDKKRANLKNKQYRIFYKTRKQRDKQTQRVFTKRIDPVNGYK